MAIKLGEKVKDVVTGFEGIAVARIVYINGCVQFGVKAKMREGKLSDVEYIDETQLVFVNRGINKATPKKQPGGDMSDKPQKNYYKRR